MALLMAVKRASQMADLRAGCLAFQMAGYWVVPMAEKKVVQMAFQIAGYLVEMMAVMTVESMARDVCVNNINQEMSKNE